ncbi:hypothetical protein GCM10010280_11040 [Streptomyces pilosus]|uniref:Uncharacterized protein n=1 Tax=Streptomyces pilosus TaxID=28893 RepID=A0A918BG19_9ACTN|nr:hypothetical protein GCM10010280_11040 [Streptomyces pilosus]
MQGGVQQGRVQTVGVRAGGGRVVQRDLRVHAVRVPPDRPHTLERRSVAVAQGGQVAVQRGGVHGDGAPRRPHARLRARRRRGGRCGGRCNGGQRPGDVPGPRRLLPALPALPVVAGVGGVLRTGVDGEDAAPGRVGPAHRHLERHATALGQDERRLDGQFVDPRAAGQLARVGGELHEGGAGQQGRVQDEMVGQPRLRALGEPAGEHQAVRAGQRDQGTQQRVGRGSLAEAGGVTGSGGGVQPVVAVLEGVRRQVHVPGCPAVRVPFEDRAPPDGPAAYVELGEAGQQALLLRSFAAQRGDRQHVLAGK